MNAEIESLLAEVDAYLAQTGMAASTFGRKTVNDGKCIQRLRGGGRCWPENIAAMRKFMADNPPATPAETKASVETAAN